MEARRDQTVAFRAPADLIERFRERVAEQERTVSAQLRLLMQREVDDREREAA